MNHAQGAGDEKSLGDLDVTVSVQLCEKPLPLAKILDLQLGTILMFPQRCDGALPIFIDQSLVGRGHAVDLEEKKLGVVVDELAEARGDGLT